MTQDDLMQMAREAGIEIIHGEAWVDQYHLTPEVVFIANAILERAAEIADTKGHYWSGASASAMFAIAEDIRALKINTGD